MASNYDSGSSNTIQVLMFGRVSEQDLQHHFSRFGTVCQVHSYFEPGSTHTLGTYITFADGGAARASLIKDDLLIEGVRVQVCPHAGPIPRHSSIPQGSASLQRPKTVKVSMFNGQLTPHELRQLFQRYGTLTSEPIVRGGSPVYSYINFDDAESAKRASISVNQKNHGGVLLKARLYESKPSRTNSHSSMQVSGTAAALLSTSATQYPSTWRQPQTDNVKLFDVNPQSPEWREVVTAFRTTMSQARLLSIKRIQNKELYEDYDREKQKMAKKKKPLNEKRFFHGSKKAQPELIYESDKGFDFRFSGTELLWGQGTYFAEKASFADMYSYKNPQGHREILMATVITGETCRMDKEDKTLKLPPLKPGQSKERYDSVSAYHDAGSEIVVVYQHALAYPEYLIAYS